VRRIGRLSEQKIVAAVRRHTKGEFVVGHSGLPGSRAKRVIGQVCTQTAPGAWSGT
jgi:hypothetical protein